MAPRKNDWQGVAPADMTTDQLAAACRAVQTAFAAQQALSNNLNLANMHLQAEVANRFGLSIPGVPPQSQLGEYNGDFVSEYTWPTPEPEPVEDAPPAP